MTRKSCYIARLGTDVWIHKTAQASRAHAYALTAAAPGPWFGFCGGHVSDWDVYLAHQGPLTIHEEFSHDSR